MFCRKNWIKEPEDHGGRLSELHEVPDVPFQFPYICKYSEFSFCPEPLLFPAALLPGRTGCGRGTEHPLSSVLAVTEGFAASKDAQPFSKPAQRAPRYSLARGSSGKAVTSGVRGLSLNGRRNCPLLLGVHWETVFFLPRVLGDPAALVFGRKGGSAWPLCGGMAHVCLALGCALQTWQQLDTWSASLREGVNSR